ncbi:putative spermidine/putrescine transport system substrate-binding protein [Bradyrhizobium sp. USDA 4503]
MNRRKFLKLSSISAASLVAVPPSTLNKKKFGGVTLRINGYGGLYDKALIDSVAKPLEEKTGLKIEYMASTTSADVVKLISNKGNPHIDLFMGDSPLMPQIMTADVIDPFTAAEVPNISRVLPNFREFGDYGAPFSVATIVPVYNSDTIETPLTSYSDIARRDLKGKVAIFASNQFPAFLALLALAEENGGSLTNLEPGYKVLRAAKENIVALVTSSVAHVQLFRQGEAQAGLLWDGRAYELRKTGTSMQTVVPGKGLYAITTYVSVVKGGRNKEAALAYINQMLSDDGMMGLPRTLRYGPTTDVKLDEIASEILINSPERAALKKSINWASLMQRRSEITERINKERQG